MSFKLTALTTPVSAASNFDIKDPDSIFYGIQIIKYANSTFVHLLLNSLPILYNSSVNPTVQCLSDLISILLLYSLSSIQSSNIASI